MKPLTSTTLLEIASLIETIALATQYGLELRTSATDKGALEIQINKTSEGLVDYRIMTLESEDLAQINMYIAGITDTYVAIELHQAKD